MVKKTTKILGAQYNLTSYNYNAELSHSASIMTNKSS